MPRGQQIIRSECPPVVELQLTDDCSALNHQTHYSINPCCRGEEHHLNYFRAPKTICIILKEWWYSNDNCCIMPSGVNKCGEMDLDSNKTGWLGKYLEKRWCDIRLKFHHPAINAMTLIKDLYLIVIAAEKVKNIIK